jgi:hypothetical protein
LKLSQGSGPGNQLPNHGRRTPDPYNVARSKIRM